MNVYEDIRAWKSSQIASASIHTAQLNALHDEVMTRVFQATIAHMNEPPPCKFAWFVTGSGGRMEQGLVSDQDHGIVYEEDSEQAKGYFAELGQRLADGMFQVGYPYCEGNVMSSNPNWCQALTRWQQQLIDWMEEGSWSSIRNLQIFYDARVVVGEGTFIPQLKTTIHQYCHEHPQMIKRFYENIRHVKSCLGPLGQLLVEEKGLHAGAIDLKYGAFIPYVNAVRLLALLEGVHETSTLGRLRVLSEAPDYHGDWAVFYQNFSKLLEIRLQQAKQKISYDDSHYLLVSKLSKPEQKELKQILKDAKKLQQYVQKQVERSGLHGI